MDGGLGRASGRERPDSLAEQGFSGVGGAPMLAWLPAGLC